MLEERDFSILSVLHIYILNLWNLTLAIGKSRGGMGKSVLGGTDEERMYQWGRITIRFNGART